MKKLYATIDVNGEDSKSKIKYYELQKQCYGIEIVKEVNDKILERKVINNITDNKRNINKVLELFTKQLITPESAEYIENDIVC